MRVVNKKNGRRDQDVRSRRHRRVMNAIGDRAAMRPAWARTRASWAAGSRRMTVSAGRRGRRRAAGAAPSTGGPPRASNVIAINKPALVSRLSSESLGSPRAFIRDVFPDAHATILGAVDVEARDAPHWQLAMVGRTLYARMPSADAERAADLRDTVVAVLERADELGSDAVVVVLEKNDQELGASWWCEEER